MSDIKEKFGTGWIGTGSGGAAADDRPRSGRYDDDDRPRSGSRDDDDRPRSGGYDGARTRGGGNVADYGSGTGGGANLAFMTLGKQMIRFLRETGEVDRLYSLADKMKLGPDDLAPVVEWLAQNYYIRVTPDTYGNHEIQLTGRAGDLA